jgi:hypothetical protein
MQHYFYALLFEAVNFPPNEIVANATNTAALEAAPKGESEQKRDWKLFTLPTQVQLRYEAPMTIWTERTSNAACSMFGSAASPHKLNWPSPSASSRVAVAARRSGGAATRMTILAAN